MLIMFQELSAFKDDVAAAEETEEVFYTVLKKAAETRNFLKHVCIILIPSRFEPHFRAQGVRENSPRRSRHQREEKAPFSFSVVIHIAL